MLKKKLSVFINNSKFFFYNNIFKDTNTLKQ